jgi:hypothetical protein
MRRRQTALRNSRVAAAMAALALGVSLCGVTPADAVRAVKRALNADAVDGLSAAKTPQPGKLLALDGKGQFPAAVLSGATRGPRGPQGPAGGVGTTGPDGPSGAAEVYIDRNNLGNDVPTGGITTIVELRVPAGSYALDFSAHTYTFAPSTFVDCQITTNGQQVVKTAAMIGSSAQATVEAVLAMNEAVSLSESTVIRVLCSERSDTDAKITDARLRAARVTSVIEQ